MNSLPRGAFHWPQNLPMRIAFCPSNIRTNMRTDRSNLGQRAYMKNTKKKKTESQQPDHPMMVAIGASAGGVRALQELFSSLPDDTGAAFVVVVHLDPQHRSELPKIISGKTRMPVTQVENREKLQANHVYVIPPDRRLQVIDHEI